MAQVVKSGSPPAWHALRRLRRRSGRCSSYCRRPARAHGNRDERARRRPGRSAAPRAAGRSWSCQVGPRSFDGDLEAGSPFARPAEPCRALGSERGGLGLRLGQPQRHAHVPEHASRRPELRRGLLPPAGPTGERSQAQATAGDRRPQPEALGEGEGLAVAPLRGVRARRIAPREDLADQVERIRLVGGLLLGPGQLGRLPRAVLGTRRCPSVLQGLSDSLSRSAPRHPADAGGR